MRKIKIFRGPEIRSLSITPHSMTIENGEGFQAKTEHDIGESKEVKG